MRRGPVGRRGRGPRRAQRLAPEHLLDHGAAHPRAIGAAERLQRLHAGRGAQRLLHALVVVDRSPVRQAVDARVVGAREEVRQQARRARSAGRRASGAPRPAGGAGGCPESGGRAAANWRPAPAGRGCRRSPASASSAGTTSAGSTTSSPGGTAARSRPATAGWRLRRSACGVLEVRVAEPVPAVQQVARGLVELRREVARGGGDQRRATRDPAARCPSRSWWRPARGGGRAPAPCGRTAGPSRRRASSRRRRRARSPSSSSSGPAAWRRPGAGSAPGWCSSGRCRGRRRRSCARSRTSRSSAGPHMSAWPPRPLISSRGCPSPCSRTYSRRPRTVDATSFHRGAHHPRFRPALPHRYICCQTVLVVILMRTLEKERLHAERTPRPHLPAREGPRPGDRGLDQDAGDPRSRAARGAHRPLRRASRAARTACAGRRSSTLAAPRSS